MKSLYKVMTIVCLMMFTAPSFAGDKVNINTAAVSQLQEVKGIGAKTAVAIVEYRKSNGKFKKLEDLKGVKGIGDKKLKKLQSQLQVKGSSVKAKKKKERKKGEK
ncbi:MAG: helix-hairpin-helix domain-containing protein [Ghiorsea sp.]